MIARIQKSMAEKDKGFTLIELLVVIIIIGILAAIAIPMFLNQRKKAVDAGIKSDLRSIATEIESYFVDAQTYPADDAVTGLAAGSATVTVPAAQTGLSAANITKSNANTVFTYDGDGANGFTITGTNSVNGTGATFTYNSQAGGLQ